METKEKNRDEARRPVRRKSDRNPESAGSRTTQQRGATAAAAPRKKAASQDAARPRKENIRQPDPGKATQQPRPRRAEGTGAPRSAPQGTGPRKSAPRSAKPESAARNSAAAAGTVKKSAAKKSGLAGLFSGGTKKKKRNLTPEERAQQRRREEEAAQERKKRREMDAPAVVYTQPAPFNRDRLLMRILAIVAVVAAVIVGMSVFFKVKYITVSGAEIYSAYVIQQASGITEGDNLLTFSKAKASARIQAEHAFVDNVRIGIKLPDTVIIYIDELDVAYSVNSIDDGWWLINSGGKVVKQITQKEAEGYTMVEGVAIQNPQVGMTAEAAEEVPTETLESGDPIPVTVTGAQRLSTALQILQQLEANDIVGDAASVNVTSLEDITLWYGSRYEVLLGNADRMDYKIACMNDAILQMSDYDSGILDVTFTTWINQVGYTPFG